MATRKHGAGRRSSGGGGTGSARRGSSGRRANTSTGSRRATLREQLEQAASGLYLTSEADSPLKYFCLPTAGGDEVDSQSPDLSPEGFLVRLGVSSQFTDDNEVPVTELVSERTLDDFLQHVYVQDAEDSESASDDAGGETAELPKPVRKLKALLEQNLRGVKVLRVGTVEVRCYLAGIDKRGDITGLVTTAIET